MYIVASWLGDCLSHFPNMNLNTSTGAMVTVFLNVHLNYMIYVSKRMILLSIRMNSIECIEKLMCSMCIRVIYVH